MTKPKQTRSVQPILTETEWVIMKVVWEHEPCAAGDVQDVLHKDRNWAYSTVKTTMDRMVEKGLLTVKKVRNLQLFSASVSETEAKKGECRKILKRAFDGALTPMMQFLIENEDLSKKDLEQLRRLINKVQKSK
jgi:BlaI family penicillinase repressor